MSNQLEHIILEDLSVPLSPVYFLDRAAAAFANREAIVDGDLRFTYGEFADRAHRLAGLLLDAGVHPGDRVAALCVNSHVMLELHNGVPLAEAVLVPVNIRLSLPEMFYIIEHSGASLIVATHEFADTAKSLSEQTGVRLLLAGSPSSEYEKLLAASQPRAVPAIDEKSLLAINYTSGSTGRPKGVMINHRGAYLQSLAMAYHSNLKLNSSYLWTLPMFHCNGWCYTWAVTAAAAVHICQRQIDPNAIWRNICSGGVTHMSAAPTILTMIAEAADKARDRTPPWPTQVGTGGAPPSPSLLARLAALNIDVTHLYGMTETYGPAVINQWQPEWSAKSETGKARLNARQGIGNVVTQAIRVVDPDGENVPADGETIGEIEIRGNNVAMGYYRDEEATLATRRDGWFRTSDLGVRYPDGYIELKDRAKDIIVTGGENVASVEIEKVLADHPCVLESAVVAREDSHWGEVPVAFVVFRPGTSATEAELISFVRDRIAHFKAPKEIRFEDLPKTSTGKIQKHVLRARLNTSSSES